MGLCVLTPSLTTNETVLFIVWIIVIFVIMPVLAGLAGWFTARLVYSRHDSELAIDHHRLRKYACRSCGHGYGHHIDAADRAIGCIHDQAMMVQGCGCHCYIGITPPTKLTPHRIDKDEPVNV